MKNQKNKIVSAIANKSSRIYLILFAILFAVVISRAVMMGGNGKTVTRAPTLSYNFSDVVNAARDKKIAEISVSGESASGILTDGAKFKSTFAYDPELLAKISESGASVKIERSWDWGTIISIGFMILLAVFFIFPMFKIGRSGGAGAMPGLSKYNQTKITTGKSTVTFKDVAGIDSAKTEVSELVDYLKHPEKFKSLGARPPRGVLLSGEPGTGKTLLARAVAGEANVPFFATSGSDFAGIIVGLGVAKIKEIFEMARRNSPCILFIDEIDAIGAHRGRSGLTDQDREQTLNQLLIEMDGFTGDTGVIVIGATNRADLLDAALLRPGRFDRQVYIDLPDLAGRDAILKLYEPKFKIEKSADMKNVARGTTGFSGADLENLLNESALLAARNNHKQITNGDLDEARDKILMGPKKDKKISDNDKKLTAYHEAGHAFVALHYKSLTDPIHKATIIPRGRALGMVQHLPIDDKVSLTVSEIRARLSVYMAGRAAEEVFFGAKNITTGAEHDIAAATATARYAVVTAGLSEKIGTVAVNQMAVGWGQRRGLENASEKTAEAVDAEIKRWIDAAHADAKKIIAANRARMKRLADELLKRETLALAEIEKIVKK